MTLFIALHKSWLLKNMNKYVPASFFILVLGFLTPQNMSVLKTIMSLFPIFVRAFGNKIEKTNALIRRA